MIDLVKVDIETPRLDDLSSGNTINYGMSKEQNKNRKKSSKTLKKILRKLFVDKNSIKKLSVNHADDDIDIDSAANLKCKVNDNTINSGNWSIELIDNAIDANASCITFNFKSFYDDGRVKEMEIGNNGDRCFPGKAKDVLFGSPTVLPEHDTADIGRYGQGVIGTCSSAGTWSVKSYREDGTPYIMSLVPCIDGEANTPHPSIGSMTHDTMSTDVRGYRLYESDCENPHEYNFSICIDFFKDCRIDITPESIEKAASLRVSQLNNFSVRIKNSADPVTEHSDRPIRKTYFGALADDGTPISSIEQCKKAPEPFVYKGMKWTYYYCTAISSKHDREQYKILKGKVSNNFILEHEGSRDKGWPLFSILNQNGVVMCTKTKGLGYGIGHKYSSKRHLRLRSFLKPEGNVSDLFAQNKIMGFLDEKYEKGFKHALKKFQIKHDIRSDYKGIRSKDEDSLVQQFIDKITSDTDRGELLRYQVGALLGVKPSTLKDATDWGEPFKTDARNEIVKLMMEFQKDTSDFRHVNDIEARINAVCRVNTIYESVIWVAENHTKRTKLIKQLKGLDWGDGKTHLKRIYLLTHNDWVSGFDPSTIKYIDIREDVINKK